MKINALCPSCGSEATVYVHNKLITFSVSCKADDANYHGHEGVSDDWCPGECTTRGYQTEAQAIEAWNNGDIINEDN